LAARLHSAAAVALLLGATAKSAFVFFAVTPILTAAVLPASRGLVISIRHGNHSYSVDETIVHRTMRFIGGNYRALLPSQPARTTRKNADAVFSGKFFRTFVQEAFT
jgi:hypothetical protein